MFSALEAELPYMVEIFGTEMKFDGNTIALILYYLTNTVMTILHIYLACCLGHLCRGKRGLFAVLFYFAINVVVSVLSATVQAIASSDVTDATINSVVQGTVAYSLPLSIGLCLLFFFFTERILRTRLNLE